MRKLFFAFFVLAGATAHGVVIMSNYPPTNDSAISAGLTTLRIKALGFVMPNSSYILNSVRVRLLFTTAAGLAAVPVVNILAAGTPTAPGGIVFSMADPGGHVLGAGDYTFTAASSFTLMANTKYWVSVAGTSTQSGMDWRGSSPAITPTGLATHDGSLFTANGGTSWTNSATLNTYEISGSAVPEPATLAALGMGLAVVARRRARR